MKNGFPCYVRYWKRRYIADVIVQDSEWTDGLLFCVRSRPRDARRLGRNANRLPLLNKGLQLSCNGTEQASTRLAAIQTDIWRNLARRKIGLSLSIAGLRNKPMGSRSRELWQSGRRPFYGSASLGLDGRGAP
jgi:hypothetical protein